jgi:hypothetical protein
MCDLGLVDSGEAGAGNQFVSQQFNALHTHTHTPEQPDQIPQATVSYFCHPLSGLHLPSSSPFILPKVPSFLFYLFLGVWLQLVAGLWIAAIDHSDTPT